MGWIRVKDGFVFEAENNVPPQHEPEIKKNVIPVPVEEIQEEIQEEPKIIIQPKAKKRKK